MSVSITIYANALLDSAGVMFFRQRTFTRFISSVILWQQSYLCILLLHTIICQIRSEFSTLVKSDPSMSRTFVNKYWICLPVNNRIIVRITFLLLFRIVKHIFVCFLNLQFKLTQGCQPQIIKVGNFDTRWRLNIHLTL